MKKIISMFILSLGFISLTEASVVQADVIIPENTKCKKIETAYTNVEAFNGENPKITRACIGWAPNFPSTRVEGGQGTYFYFAYKLFPTPMPAYNVTTSDDLGLNQSFSMTEPIEQLGACDPKGADATECKMYEPFLYYPAKWEDRFKSAPLEEFKGPYTVGPHEFYHYRYRGRLVPQQITFHYDVIDMEGNGGRVPLATGDIVYDVPDDCYSTSIIDINDNCRTIQFYIPVKDPENKRTLPTDATVTELPKDRIRFYNPGEHTFRVAVDEKQMYLYQTDEGVEWQGKTDVYRHKWEEKEEEIEVEVKEPKYVEIHRYDEGVYDGNDFDPSTNLGTGNWCVGYETCGFPSDGVKMTPTYEYDRDGYKGTLTQIDEAKTHVLTEGKPTDYRYYANRTLTGDGECYQAIAQVGPDKGQEKTYCDTNGAGYDYMQRGVFKKSDGEIYYSGWRAHSQGVLFPGWEANLHTEHPDFIGYEWKRYQILGGWVYPTETEEPKITPKDPVITETLEYGIGPVITHTLKTLAHGEIEWVNQDTFKNHCYSEEDAFSDFGEWEKENAKFKEKDSPAIVCFHNHGDDFHYWEFKWSPVKKFGGDIRKGLLFD